MLPDWYVINWSHPFFRGETHLGHGSSNPWLPLGGVSPLGNGEVWQYRPTAHGVDSAKRLPKKAARLKSVHTKLSPPFMSADYPPSDSPWVWGQVKRQQKMISGQFQPQEVFTGKLLGKREAEQPASEGAGGPGHTYAPGPEFSSDSSSKFPDRIRLVSCWWPTALKVPGSPLPQGLPAPWSLCLERSSPCSPCPSAISFKVTSSQSPSQTTHQKQAPFFFITVAISSLSLSF